MGKCLDKYDEMQTFILNDIAQKVLGHLQKTTEAAMKTQARKLLVMMLIPEEALGSAVTESTVCC